MTTSAECTLITGASSGIGKAMARYCGKKGMNLLLISLPGENLSQVADEIAKECHVFTDYLEIDLTLPDGPLKVHEWTLENGYDVNILINNAGVAGSSVFESSELKYIDDRILLNIRALVLLSRLFLPVLKRHPKSYILNVGSMAGFFSIPFKSMYSSSKAFVVSFSRSLKTELKGSGISISVLCPNGVQTNSKTEVNIKSHGKMGHLTQLNPEQVARKGIDGMLAGKFLIIPGVINYFLLFLRSILPRWLQQRILKSEFLKEVKATERTRKSLVFPENVHPA